MELVWTTDATFSPGIKPYAMPISHVNGKSNTKRITTAAPGGAANPQHDPNRQRYCRIAMYCITSWPKASNVAKEGNTDTNGTFAKYDVVAGEGENHQGW